MVDTTLTHQAAYGDEVLAVLAEVGRSCVRWQPQPLNNLVDRSEVKWQEVGHRTTLVVLGIEAILADVPAQATTESRFLESLFS